MEYKIENFDFSICQLNFKSLTSNKIIIDLLTKNWNSLKRVKLNIYRQLYKFNKHF